MSNNIGLLNSITLKQINSYIKNPSTTVVINDNGDRLSSDELTQYIYENIKLKSRQPIISIVSDKSIGIDDIRSLKKTLQLSADKSSSISRFVVIESSERLTIEAQNSLLKLTEELPKNTVICLKTSKPKELLETIISRSYMINVLPVKFDDMLEHYSGKSLDELILSNIYQLSSGMPGQIKQLITGKLEQSGQMMLNAKKFITSSAYDKQIFMQKFLSDKEDLVQFINTLKVLTRSGMNNAKTTKKKKRWSYNLSVINEIQNMLKFNVLKKIAILSLSLKLK